MFKKILFSVFSLNFAYCTDGDLDLKDSNAVIMKKLAACLDKRTVPSLSASATLDEVLALLNDEDLRVAFIEQYNQRDRVGSYEDSTEKELHEISKIVSDLKEK